MSSPSLEDKVGSEQRGTQIREHFLGWQCRIREYIMRQGKGRPTPGICPRLILEDGLEASSALTLLLLPREPRESILQFRYMVLRTHDPQDRYNKAVQLLSSTFYQDPEDFSGVMTGLISSRSNRQPKFILPSIRDLWKKVLNISDLALKTALWCRFCFGEYESGKVIFLDDNNSERLRKPQRKQG